MASTPTAFPPSYAMVASTPVDAVTTTASESVASTATATSEDTKAAYKPFYLSDEALIKLVDGCAQGPQAATGDSLAFFRENTKIFTPASDREFHPELVRSSFAIYNLLARSAGMLGADLEGLLPNDVRKNFLRDFILYMARDVLGSVPFPQLLVNGIESAIGRANPASTILRDAARIMFCSVGCGQLLRIKDHDLAKAHYGWDIHYVASALHTKLSSAEGEEAAQLHKELTSAEGKELLAKLENLGLKNEAEDLTWSRVNLSFTKDGYDAQTVWKSLDPTYLQTVSSSKLSDEDRIAQTDYINYVKAGCQATAAILNYSTDAAHHVRLSNIMTLHHEERLKLLSSEVSSSEGVIGPIRQRKDELRQSLLKETLGVEGSLTVQQQAQATVAVLEFCDSEALNPPSGARHCIHEVRQVQLLLTLPMKYTQWEHLFKEVESITGCRIFEGHAGATNMLVSDMYVAVAWVIQRVAADWEKARNEKKAEETPTLTSSV